jgi:hypothetical protein
MPVASDASAPKAHDSCRASGGCACFGVSYAAGRRLDFSAASCGSAPSQAGRSHAAPAARRCACRPGKHEEDVSSHDSVIEIAIHILAASYHTLQINHSRTCLLWQAPPPQQPGSGLRASWQTQTARSTAGGCTPRRCGRRWRRTAAPGRRPGCCARSRSVSVLMLSLHLPADSLTWRTSVLDDHVQRYAAVHRACSDSQSELAGAAHRRMRSRGRAWRAAGPILQQPSACC